MIAVDAHQHFWDPTRASYPWMTDELAAIRRPFGPKDLRPLLAANGIDRTILVQTRSSEDETRELLETAAASDFVAGVVGWVDLTADDVAARLAALRAGSGGAKLVGIRHQAHDEGDPEWLVRPEVQRGIAAVGRAGLVYELLVRSRELPAAFTTVRAHPDMRFVIDHLAKPRIASGEIDEWSERLSPFGALPNVMCKLSGMVTEADWHRWTARDLEPYVRRVLEWFGPSRCAFGSDWPVCLLAASYETVVATCRSLIGDLAAADRERILGGNAVALYRIAVPAAAS